MGTSAALDPLSIPITRNLSQSLMDQSLGHAPPNQLTTPTLFATPDTSAQSPALALPEPTPPPPAPPPVAAPPPPLPPGEHELMCQCLQTFWGWGMIRVGWGGSVRCCVEYLNAQNFDQIKSYRKYQPKCFHIILFILGPIIEMCTIFLMEILLYGEW